MIGVDIEKIARFERLRSKPGFTDKLLTDRERAYWDGRDDDLATLAGIWCAKEAVVKALGTGFGEFGYRDVEIRYDGCGAPSAYVAKCGCALEVSISHTDDTCVAVAMKI